MSLFPFIPALNSPAFSFNYPVRSSLEFGLRHTLIINLIWSLLLWQLRKWNWPHFELEVRFRHSGREVYRLFLEEKEQMTSLQFKRPENECSKPFLSSVFYLQNHKTFINYQTALHKPNVTEQWPFKLPAQQKLRSESSKLKQTLTRNPTEMTSVSGQLNITWHIVKCVWLFR